AVLMVLFALLSVILSSMKNIETKVNIHVPALNRTMINHNGLFPIILCVLVGMTILVVIPDNLPFIPESLFFVPNHLTLLEFIRRMLLFLAVWILIILFINKILEAKA